MNAEFWKAVRSLPEPKGSADAYLAEALHHLKEWRVGKLVAPDGEPRLAHAATCLLAILWLELAKAEA